MLCKPHCQIEPTATLNLAESADKCCDGSAYRFERKPLKSSKTWQKPPLFLQYAGGG